MKYFYAILAALLVTYGTTSHAQDVITFRTGKQVECKILGFNNGYFAVQLDTGETKQAPVSNITDISFGDNSAAVSTPSAPDSAATPVDEVAPVVNEMVKADIGVATQQPVKALNKDIKLTVKKYDNKVSLKSEYSRYIRTKGLKAVSVNVLVENKSTNEIEIDWASFKIKDQDDNVFDASIYATGSRESTSRTLIQPGDKVAVWISFEASPGIVMEESWIRYDDVSKSIFSDWFPVGGGK